MDKLREFPKTPTRVYLKTFGRQTTQNLQTRSAVNFSDIFRRDGDKICKSLSPQISGELKSQSPASGKRSLIKSGTTVKIAIESANKRKTVRFCPNNRSESNLKPTVDSMTQTDRSKNCCTIM